MPGSHERLDAAARQQAVAGANQLKPDGQAADKTQTSTHKDALDSILGLVDSLLRKRRAREVNSNPSRPVEGDLRKLDSSVKRNTAVVKRLRQISDEAVASLLEEINRTNQSRYVSEAAASISEANLRPKDIPAAVQVCAALHQRYEDFGNEVGSALAQQSIPTDEDKPGSARRRVVLRLLVELLSNGICLHPEPLMQALATLTARISSSKRTPAPEGSPPATWQVHILPVVAAFAKAGREELLRLPPQPPPEPPASQAASEGGLQDATTSDVSADFAEAKVAYEFELSQQWHLPEALGKKLLHMVSTVFEAACSALEAEHSALLEAEQEVARVLNSRGDVPEDMGMAYEQQRRAFEGLQRTVATLGEVLSKPLPQLPEANLTRMAASGGVTAIFTKATEASPDGPFEDAETRAFYESLPDLRGIVPPVLLRDKAAHEEAADSPLARELSDAASAVNDSRPESQDTVEADQAEQGPGEATGFAVRQPIAEEASEDRAADPGGPASAQGLGDVRAETGALLKQLSSITTASACDELAANLACVCSKAVRRRLVKALTNVKASTLQLLPYYMRIGATLNELFPDIGQGLAKHAEDEFASLLGSKDASQHVLQTRISNARLLAELVKFRLIPLGNFFTLLKSLLDDFVGSNIDAAAALVENAGRYLYLLSEAHTRMANMLEVMKKMKSGKSLDARQRMLLDDASYACIPPAHMTARVKARPPLQAYLRHLILERMWVDDPKKVVRKLRRFPWAQHENLMVKYLLRTVKGSYSHIATTASVTATLARYHPSLSVTLADCLLEEVRAGLEAPQAGGYQRRVGHMRLLGELYNYRVVDSRVVFSTLYLLLEFGHESPELAQRLDPPDSYFRVRLVCKLLQACGHYFHSGSASTRLERFLAFFQRYLLAKPALPFDVEFDVQELLEGLRPDMVRHETFEAANAAVAEIEAAEARRGGLDTIGEDEDDDSDAAGSDAGHRGGAPRLGSADAPSSQEAPGPASASDDEQAVKVLHAFRTEPQEEDPAFEKELAALVGGPRARQPVGAQAPPAAAAPASDLSGEDPAGEVAFQVVLRRGGSRDTQSRTVQLPAGSAIATSQQAKAAAEAAERAEMKRLVLHSSALEALPGAGPSSGGAQPALQPIRQPAAKPRQAPAAPPAARGRAPGGTAGGRGRGRRYSTHGA